MRCPRSIAPLLLPAVFALSCRHFGPGSTPPVGRPMWEDCYTHETLPAFIDSARIAAQRPPTGSQQIRDPSGVLQSPAGPQLQQAVQELSIVPNVHHHDCQALVSRGAHRAVVALLGVERGLNMSDSAFAAASGNAFPVALYVNRSTGRGFPSADIGAGPLAQCFFVGMQARAHPRDENSWWGGLGHCANATIPVTGRGFAAARWTSEAESFDYLPVVRWHWNERSGEHSFGAKCGDGWCAFARGRPEREWADSPCPDRYPGAVDVQPLAIGPAHALRVRAGTAFICAEPDLGDWTSVDDFRTTRKVATVYIGGEPGWYKGVFMTGSAAASRPNEIWLRFVPGLEPDPDDSWLMYVKRPNNTWVRLGVHKGSAALGVASKPAATTRWRWEPDDERTWIWCVNGCCSDGA